MNHRCAFFAALVAGTACALLAGCASPPATEFHTLLPAADRPPAAPATGLRFRIESPLRVPPQVDQPQIVLRRPDGSLQVLEQQRWVAPLADEWRDALAESLARQAGALDLSRVPAPPGAPPYVLQFELQRFDSTPGLAVVQQLQWSVRQGASAAVALRCSGFASEPAQDSVAAVVAAHRRAVDRLAREVAQTLQVLQTRPDAAACPAL